MKFLGLRGQLAMSLKIAMNLIMYVYWTCMVLTVGLELTQDKCSCGINVLHLKRSQPHQRLFSTCTSAAVRIQILPITQKDFIHPNT